MSDMDTGGLTTGYMTWSNQDHAMPVPEKQLIRYHSCTSSSSASSTEDEESLSIELGTAVGTSSSDGGKITFWIASRRDRNGLMVTAGTVVPKCVFASFPGTSRGL